MDRSSRLAALAAMLFICAASPTSAAVVYDEAVSGDLASSGTLKSLLLASGANTVRGSVTFSFPDIPPDFDAFIFTVPHGLSLTDIQFTAALLEGIGAGTLDSVSMRLWTSPGGQFVGLDSKTIPTSPAAELFASNLPLTAGDYRFEFSAFGGALTSGEFRTASYEITLNLDAAPMPEPSSLALVLLSVGLLAGAAARKAKS